MARGLVKGKPVSPLPSTRPSLAVRWGTWVARHRWMLSVWAVVLVAAALSYPHLLRSLSASDYSVTGSDSARVAQLIESDFKGRRKRAGHDRL
jgi:uncharacterized membrane protein YdfJ with MMPL/SSD domain